MKVLVAVLVSGFALVAPAAASALTATDVRVGDHAGFVRVVVDFRGGVVREHQVTLERGQRIFASGRAAVSVARRGVRSAAGVASAHGVRVRVARGAGRITVRIAASAGRFKYVSYLTLGGPQRLVIDLIKAAPPTSAATVLDDGCLRLETWSVTAGRARAAGRALQRLFENGLAVTVRRASGRAIRTRGVVAANGRWRAALRYSVSRSQRGTLEAVVLSAKDGSLDCLVQVPVTLAPS